MVLYHLKGHTNEEEYNVLRGKGKGASRVGFYSAYSYSSRSLSLSRLINLNYIYKFVVIRWGGSGISNFDRGRLEFIKTTLQEGEGI